MVSVIMLVPLNNLGRVLMRRSLALLSRFWHRPPMFRKKGIADQSCSNPISVEEPRFLSNPPALHSQGPRGSQPHPLREKVVEDGRVPLEQKLADSAESVEFAHSRLVWLSEWRCGEEVRSDPVVF